MFKKIQLKYSYSLILLKQLIITDFKLRYQNSVLGYLWSLLRPLALFCILYFVVFVIFKADLGVPHGGAYLLLGLVLWNYFSEVTNNAVGVIVGRGELIRKINFPKYVIVLSGSFSALINLFLNLVVVALFMAATGVEVRMTILLAPFLIVELFIFALAMAFLLSALYVKLRDLNYIWEVLMLGAFYATPIFYSFNNPTAEKFGKILLLNPMAQIIQDTRNVVITSQSKTITSVYGSSLMRLLPLTIVFAVAIVSSWYFRKRSKYFAEEI